jgi:alpha-beta hydrolase superfamily lysophospholipase
MKVRAREHFFKSGGARLFFRAWEAPAARGTVLVVHGLGEHSGRHARLASHLRKARFATVAFDLRGHGRSEGPRAHLERFAQYVEDLAVFQSVVEDQGRPGGRFLLGHSLGGLIAVHYWLVERPPDLAGLVLSSPALAPRFRVSPARRSLARLLVRLPPAVRLSHGIRPEHLSHDPAIAAECARDRLYQTRATPRAILAILDAMDEVRSRASELTAPLLALGGEDDRLVSPMALRDFVRQAGSADKRGIVYPRFYHEVFNEAERERPLADLTDWLDERCP